MLAVPHMGLERRSVEDMAQDEEPGKRGGEAGKR
jgi:hypothetical protein